MTSTTKNIVIDPEPLAAMRTRGGDWFCYENHDLSHPLRGHCQFLQCGPGRTYSTPPKKMPDTAQFIGWRYVLVGQVDLTTGTVVEIY